MKRVRSLFALFAALAFAATLRAEDYRVGAGDALSVRVVGQKDMDGFYTVSPDGEIAFPLVGRLPVKGKSLAEIQEDITQRLKTGFVKHPVVSVSLEKSNSRKYFVYGEVNTSGEFRLPEDGMTVLRAVAMAGGLTKAASESKVRLLRPQSGGGAYEVIEVDLKLVMDGKTADPAVRDRDMIIIREGWF